MAKRKICVVTGSRAEYGLLRWLMQEIRDDPRLQLQIVVTGMHLAPQFGSTYREIEADGFSIDAKVDMQLTSDTESAVTKAVGIGVIGFADVLQNLHPDLLVVLGDRFEILAAVQAAMLALVPIAHVHGGELTEGAVDDAIRHALTKMSHLHFAAAEPYRRRIIQMGESPDQVFAVGAPGVDNIKRIKPLSRHEFEVAIGMTLGQPSFLVTYHPETLGVSPPCSAGGLGPLLEALDSFPQSRIVFTSPNADAGGRAISEAIKRYAAARPERAVFCASLGQKLYFSALAHVDLVIGNSSSGIIEAPAAGVPTVNIGERQKGRLRSASVIDCAPLAPAIVEAVRRALTPEFRHIAETAVPAYGAGDAAGRIRDIVATFPLDRLARKVFHDLA
jgi:UDP-hydrolysing UDP-N-acetyl-D-glucosamine 2-epimerase